MKQLAKIEAFFCSEKFVLLGVNRDAKKFGHIVFKTLIEKGFEIIPVNPAVDDISGHKCYRDLSSINGQISHVILVTPPQQTDNVVREAIKLGIKHIWVQRGSQTAETEGLTAKSNVETYINECILMYARPSGIHKFHRNMVLFFSKLFSKG